MAGTSSPRSVLSHRVRPSMRTARPARSARRRGQVDADLDRRPVGGSLARWRGDAVVELGVARPGRRRGTRPARRRPARRVVARPNRLLPLRVPPRARISGARHAVRPHDATATATRPATIEISIAAPSPSPSSCPRARTRAATVARPTPSPTTAATIASGRPAPAMATRAASDDGRGRGRDDRVPCARRARRTTLRVRPSPIARAPSATASDRDHPRDRGHRDDERRRGERDPGRHRRRSPSAATSRAEHEDERDDPAGPEAGSFRARSARHGVTGEQRVGGVGQAVEVQAAGDDRHGRDRRDRAEHGLPTGRRGRPAARPPRARRPRRRAANAAAPGRSAPPGREPATGRRVSEAVTASPHRRPPSAGRARAGGRAPDRPRRPPGSVRRRASSAGGPSATIRPPSMTTTRGKKWAARARSWRTATIVVPSRSLRSTSSCMTSTWWRMSRCAVGSSRTRIGAAWARATAMNTSCRSPIDSSRTSRCARCAMPDPLDRRVDRRDGRCGRSPVNGGSWGSRPSATTSSTGIANGQLRRARGRPRSSARRRSRSTSRDRRRRQADRPAARLEHAGQGAQQRRLAGAVGPDDARPARRRAMASVAPSTMRRPLAVRDGDVGRPRGSGRRASQLVPRARPLRAGTGRTARRGWP